MTDFQPSVPPISVEVVIDPPAFALGGPEGLPCIAITATSHASQPITIFTWPTIFNLDLAQKRANFSCQDTASNALLRLELTKGPKRSGPSRAKDGPDDIFFQTLEPKTSVVFSATFKLARRINATKDLLVEGHKYRFNVRDGETIQWWRYGKKEDVMAPPDHPAELGDPSGGPIPLRQVAPVYFEVKQRVCA